MAVSARDLAENLRRRVAVAVVAMPGRHIFKCAVAFGLARIPVQALPVITQYVTKRVAGRQGDSNAVAALGAGCLRSEQIVLVAKLHLADPWSINGCENPASIQSQAAFFPVLIQDGLRACVPPHPRDLPNRKFGAR